MSNTFEPDKYQTQFLKTWDDSITDGDQLLHAVLGLLGETGELADLYKKLLFKPNRGIVRSDLVDELADVFYYVGIAAVCLGVTIEDLRAYLAVKLADGHGWIDAGV